MIKKVEGGYAFKKNVFSIFFHFEGGDTTSGAVLVPGTTIGSGEEIPPIPPP